MGYEERHLLSISMESTMIPTTPKKRSMLPFLVVLFLISYGLLALLVVEQDRTITNQRSLIQQIMGDSLELTALKGKVYQQQHSLHAKGQAAPQTSTQDDSKGSVKSRKMVRPPKDASDTPDSRRMPVSI
jgi:hypothetical protein